MKQNYSNGILADEQLSNNGYTHSSPEVRLKLIYAI